MYILEGPYPNRRCCFTDCPKLFPSQKQLKFHLKLFHGEFRWQAYICPICQSPFRHAHLLKSHQDKVAAGLTICKVPDYWQKELKGDYPKTCAEPGCSKVFKTKTGYRGHLKNVHGHLGGKPWVCKHCPGRQHAFLCKSDLEKHLRKKVDKDITLYNCFYCGKLQEEKGTKRKHELKCGGNAAWGKMGGRPNEQATMVRNPVWKPQTGTGTGTMEQTGSGGLMDLIKNEPVDEEQGFVS